MCMYICMYIDLSKGRCFKRSRDIAAEVAPHLNHGTLVVVSDRAVLIEFFHNSARHPTRSLTRLLSPPAVRRDPKCIFLGRALNRVHNYSHFHRQWLPVLSCPQT